MKSLLRRLSEVVRKLTAHIRFRRKDGKQAPVAKGLRRKVRARIRAVRDRLRSLRIDWNGHPSLRSRRLRRAVRIAARYGLVVTSTTDGGHTPTSWHYKARAVDLASGSGDQMARAQRAIDREIGRSNLIELFGPGEPNIKNGALTAPIANHEDHIHVAA